MTMHDEYLCNQNSCPCCNMTPQQEENWRGQYLKNININQSWASDWTIGNLKITSSLSDWLKCRPKNIHHLLIKFPVYCLVKGKNKPLLVPFTNPKNKFYLFGIVVSYFEPKEENPNGLLGVMHEPESEIRAQVDPSDAKVIHYYKNLTPELIKNLIKEI